MNLLFQFPVVAEVICVRHHRRHHWRRYRRGHWHHFPSACMLQSAYTHTHQSTYTSWLTSWFISRLTSSHRRRHRRRHRPIHNGLYIVYMLHTTLLYTRILIWYHNGACDVIGRVMSLNEWRHWMVTSYDEWRLFPSDIIGCMTSLDQYWVYIYTADIHVFYTTEFLLYSRYLIHSRYINDILYTAADRRYRADMHHCIISYVIVLVHV